MIVVYGLFKPSLSLELAIEIMKEKGFNADRLLVAALDSCLPQKQKIIDSMYSSDGMSLIDGMALCATVGMLLGVIYGSSLPMGPVALGLIGMLSGGGAGYIIDKKIAKKNRPGAESAGGFLLLAIQCRSEAEAFEVKRIMADHHCSAIGGSTHPATPAVRL